MTWKSNQDITSTFPQNLENVIFLYEYMKKTRYLAQVFVHRAEKNLFIYTKIYYIHTYMSDQLHEKKL